MLAMMKMAWAAAAILVVAVQFVAPVEGMGLNWTQAYQNLRPSDIVQMLKHNNISRVKLFDADPWTTVKVFAGTGIEVMPCIPNDQIASFSGYDDKAAYWVRFNIAMVVNAGVKIRYVAVGNEPFLTSYDDSELDTAFRAFYNIQSALLRQRLGDKINTTIPLKSVGFEHHWRVFRYEGQPRFTGDGNYKMLVAAKKDIAKYLQWGWCASNSNVEDMDRVPSSMDYARSSADCTALDHGSPCNDMEQMSEVSHAFSMSFQMINGHQDVESCGSYVFETILEMNISTDRCIYTLPWESGGWRLGIQTGLSIFYGMMILALFLLF